MVYGKWPNKNLERYILKWRIPLPKNRILSLSPIPPFIILRYEFNYNQSNESGICLDAAVFIF